MCWVKGPRNSENFSYVEISQKQGLEVNIKLKSSCWVVKFSS